MKDDVFGNGNDGSVLMGGIGAIGEIGGVGATSIGTRAGAGSMVGVGFKGLDGFVVLKSIGT